MIDAGGTTIKCRICGKPYKFMPYYVGDQSACPSCVRKAEENTFGKGKEWKHYGDNCDCGCRKE